MDLARSHLRCCLLAFFALIAMLPAVTAQTIPNPVLYLTRTEAYEQEGKRFVKYHFAVENYSAFPAELFAAAPELPPCGKNTKASRTWVDVFSQSGKRLYGFCAFAKPAELGDVWFSLQEDEVPPSWVYIELTDRKTNTKYKSNLADTSQ